MIARCKAFCTRITVGVWFLLFFPSTTWANPDSEIDIPDPLKPWVGWVLRNKDQHFCPAAYSRKTEFVCQWPGKLILDADARGARFEQHWTAYAEGSVFLPGDRDNWPEQVSLNGRAAVVLEVRGRPAIRVDAGEYVVEGVIKWVKRPALLNMPPHTGLLELTLDGELIAVPEINSDDSLQLQFSSGATEDKEWLRTRVFRHIVDEVPTVVETILELDVSGRAREIVLGPALLKDFFPIGIDSDIPARIDPDHRLRIQLRPGNWQVRLTSVRMSPDKQIVLPATDGQWPKEEVWVFEARPNLRVVDVTGGTPIDASQTAIKPEWAQWPAFLLKPGEALTLDQVRRGGERPEPDQLSLRRQLWLDFDGSGYTFRDRITGKKSSSWRMEATPVLSLGRVALQGKDQVITRLPGSERPGVEVRHGNLDMNAEGRIEGSASQLPANGWGQDMKSASAELNLPPGWRFWGATGVDRSRGDWLGRWTLLDFFLVLLAVIAAYRMWGWRWGAVALIALVLSWQEPGAPHLVWLNLFAAVALRRLSLKGRLRNTVRAWFVVSLAIFAVVAAPFALQQIRAGIYPQLEHKGWQAHYDIAGVRGIARTVPADSEAELMSKALLPEKMADKVEEVLVTASKRRKTPDINQLVDPDAQVQTGPGLPDWQWRTAQLDWHGRVADNHSVNLILAPPWLTRSLLFVQLMLLAALLARMCNLSLPAMKAGGLKMITGAIGVGLVLAPVFAPTPVFADTEAENRALAPGDHVRTGHLYPPPYLLKELQERLLQAPDCAPRCAAIESAGLLISGQLLTVELKVHAGARVALPLPAGGKNWLPREVRVNGRLSTVVRQDGNSLWVALEPGNYKVRLSGPVLRQSVRLPFALAPHRVEVSADGWEVVGVDEAGHTDGQVQLLRTEPNGALDDDQLVAQQLPPLLKVTRTLELGLLWRVYNHAERHSPPGQPVLMEIPLLPGESVLSSHVQVRDGKVLISLAPDQRELFWESSLDRHSELTLTAVNKSNLVEVWRVAPGYIWNLQHRGLPAIYQQANSSAWSPEWRPWPSESVTLQILRPEGIAGNWNTIDRSELAVTPGPRSTDVALTLMMRSSQGGNYEVQLPDGAELQSMTMDGRALPARQEGNKVVLPLTPGKLQFDLHWREARGVPFSFQSPKVDLGRESVNAAIKVHFPHSRWILWTTGPRLGPAVLIWGILLAAVLAAWGLAKSGYTPLNIWQWVLLLAGLSQAPLLAAGLVVVWIFVLAWREKAPKPTSSLATLGQIGLAALTIAALVSFYLAIHQGLLGQPEMQITGNLSSASGLNWYADKATGQMPVATVYSVPLWVYRLLTLAWALWIAWSLLDWLRWGWRVFLHSAPVPRPKVNKTETEKKGGEA